MALAFKEAKDDTARAIMRERDERVQQYQERDQVMHNLRRYRLMRHEPYVPKAYASRLGGANAVKLPIVYRLVQTAVSAVAKRFPSIVFEPLSAADRKAAEDTGQAASLLLQAVENQHPTPYLYGLYFTLFGDGLTVTKSLPGPWSGMPLPTEDESMSDYNKRCEEFHARYPLPFYTRIVDPLTFYPPLLEYGDGATIESAQRSTREVMTTFNLLPNGDKSFRPGDPDIIPSTKPFPVDELPPGMPAQVQVDEIWTGSECAIVINKGSQVFVFENPLGESPYTWGFGDPTGVEDPSNIGMSVAYPVYHLVPWIDTMVALMAAWSILVAPTIYTTQDPVAGVKPTAETSIEHFQPGMMYHFPTGRKPGILSPPDVGSEVTQFLNFLIESADRGGLPALVSGSGVGTRLPSLTFQAAFEAATDRLRPAVQSAEKVIAGTINKWMKIIGRYDQAIKVNGWEYTDSGEQKAKKWATIRPTEARKARRIQVSLAVDSTQDLIAKGTHAQFMQNAQLWDMDRAMRFSGVENVEETREKIAADTAWRAGVSVIAEALAQNDPDVQAMLAAEQEAEAAAQGGGAQAAPPAEAPPVPMADGGTVGAPPGPGRNRQGVPRGRGGGRRGIPTQKPRGNRQGKGKAYGRT